MKNAILLVLMLFASMLIFQEKQLTVKSDSSTEVSVDVGTTHTAIYQDFDLVADAGVINRGVVNEYDFNAELPNSVVNRKRNDFEYDVGLINKRPEGSNRIKQNLPKLTNPYWICNSGLLTTDNRIRFHTL